MIDSPELLVLIEPIVTVIIAQIMAIAISVPSGGTFIEAGTALLKRIIPAQVKLGSVTLHFNANVINFALSAVVAVGAVLATHFEVVSLFDSALGIVAAAMAILTGTMAQMVVSQAFYKQHKARGLVFFGAQR